MYTLTPELQRYLKIVDPYMTLDELAVAFKVCMTVMIRLRKDMNLDPKPKGRPKNREAIIINGIIKMPKSSSSPNKLRVLPNLKYV